jgi:putative ABC transport system permease protein
VRSFAQLRRVDAGFERAGVVAVPVQLPGARYDTIEKITGFFERLASRAAGIPGASGAALVRELPLTAPSWSSDFAIAGRGPDEFGTEVLHREITADYFDVLGVPLIRGRAFTGADRVGASPVVIINRALAERYFPGQDPIGQRMAFDRAPDSTSTWRTIVGVVGNEHQQSLAMAPRAEIFAPVFQDPTSGMTLVVRAQCDRAGECDPLALAPAIRRLVAELDPLLAPGALRTLDRVYAASLTGERFLMTLLLLFAGVGLSLGVVGVYGVLAQMARQRTREMGIRIALGARSGQVRWLVVRHGALLTVLGLAIGTAAALLSAGVMRGLLYDVAPSDPLTLGAVAAMLLVASLVACWLPAVRASRADPVAALRAD